MVYTKEEFKRMWDSEVSVTVDDCVDCAKAWGLFSRPRTHMEDEVIRAVCEAAGVTDMRVSPSDKELQIGEYFIPDDCTAKFVGRTLLVYKRKGKRLAPTEYRCKDCKHRVKGHTFGRQRYDTMVCELKPKSKNGLFYGAPLYGKPCDKFEKK